MSEIADTFFTRERFLRNTDSISTKASWIFVSAFPKEYDIFENYSESDMIDNNNSDLNQNPGPQTLVVKDPPLVANATGFAVTPARTSKNNSKDIFGTTPIVPGVASNVGTTSTSLKGNTTEQSDQATDADKTASVSVTPASKPKRKSRFNFFCFGNSSSSTASPDVNNAPDDQNASGAQNAQDASSTANTSAADPKSRCSAISMRSSTQSVLLPVQNLASAKWLRAVFVPPLDENLNGVPDSDAIARATVAMEALEKLPGLLRAAVNNFNTTSMQNGLNANRKKRVFESDSVGSTTADNTNFSKMRKIAAHKECANETSLTKHFRRLRFDDFTALFFGNIVIIIGQQNPKWKTLNREANLVSEEVLMTFDMVEIFAVFAYYRVLNG